MIRGSASLMGAPRWNRTEASLGPGALTLLSYPSVPLSSSPFDGMKRWDDRRRATLVMSGGCPGRGVRVIYRQTFSGSGSVEVAVGGNQFDGVEAIGLMAAVDFERHGELYGVIGPQRMRVGRYV
jgi:hypothetical protein